MSNRITTPEQEQDAERRDKIDAIQYESDLQEVMGTRAGRHVLWRILEKASVFHPCFTGNSKTFYLLGRRELGLEVYSEIMAHCPESFWEAQKEQHNRELQQQLAQDSKEETNG